MVALPLLTWASSKFPNSHPNKLYTNAYSWSSLSKLQAAFACSSQRCSKLRFFSRNSIWVSRKRPDFLWVSRRLLVGGVLPLVMMLGGGEGGGGGSGSASARVNKSEIEEVLTNVEWPEKFPFKEEDFQRFDETSDSSFYSSPRFVTHIDDYAIKALTEFYSTLMPPGNTPGVSILDMCSSWVSHYPSGYKQERIVGMGMNEEELKRNPVLTDCVVQDLNVSPQLPFEDCSFDAITNVVSVDYLTKPIEVFKEMRRILKPGGLAIMSFSNRCFWTKAISIWTSTSDADHVRIVGSYFHYAGGFEPPQAVDISPNPGRSDPMYIVYSRKLSA